MSKPLSPQRKGEIALLLLKQRVRQSGIKLSSETHRQITNTAKQIGVSNEEAVVFAEELVRELVDEVFSPNPQRNSEQQS